MERKNLLKSILVILLSLMLFLSFADLVYATDTDSDDTFSWEDVNVVNSADENSTENTNATNSTNSTNDTNSNTSENLLNSVSNNTTNNVNSSNTANNVVSTNTLAYTGSGNTGIIAIVVVLGVFITIFSYMKVKEYKNI